MKFLKNKAFVGVLALVAIGYVSKNIILPLFHSMMPPSRMERKGEIIQQKEDIIQQIGPMAGKSILLTDFEKLGWVLDYARDPFKIEKLQMKAEKGPIEDKETPVALEEGDKSRNYTLVAVIEEPGKRLAVINDVIVGEGDYYQDYEIIKISSDSVVLKGPGGHKKLEF